MRRIPHTWIEMGDGTRLSARVWMPDDAAQAPVPAILEYIPYRKADATVASDEQVHGYFANCGYAAVRVDLRGCGDSEGILHGEYLKQEQDDAVEVIRWIASQPWCSGEVGIIGISWGGFNGLQIAARRPPELRAVISVCSTDDRYADDIHYMGGCVLGVDMLSWATTMLAYTARPPDPVHVGERWRAMWLARLEQTPPFVNAWLSHQTRDAFWKHGSVGEDFGDLGCPVLMVGGWADAYRNAVLRVLEGYEGPCKGIIGPWSHHYPYAGAPGPNVGFLQECVRWWDHWLKGKDTGVMDEPALRAWMQDSVPPRTHYAERPGRWVGEPSWPSPHVDQRRLVLTADGRLGTAEGDDGDVILPAPPIAGVDAGDWLGYGRATDHPGDQRVEDARSATFDTLPLTEPLEILGRPRAVLELASDQPLAMVCARLCDVAPDGSSTLITRGVLNLTHRESHEHPRPLDPGVRHAACIHLNAIAHSLPAGHRLRLALSPDYWPWAWPSPVPARLTVRVGGPSALELPVRPRRASDEQIAFDAPEAAAMELVTELFSEPQSRTVAYDAVSGRQQIESTLSYFDGCRLSDGLEYREGGRDVQSIVTGNPLSAETRCERTISIERGSHSVRVEARATMSSTAAEFVVTNEIDAYEGDVRIAARRWSQTIPRNLV